MNIILTRFHHKFSSHDAFMPDLGLGYLAAALRRQGFEPAILDARLHHIPAQKLGAALKVSDRDRILVGMKIFSMDLNSAREAIRGIRARFPEAILAAGGPHPSAVGAEIFGQLPGLDYSFEGEADLGLPVLARILAETGFGSAPEPGLLAGVPGLVWSSPQGAMANAPQRVRNLDDLGLPAWDLMEVPRFMALEPRKMGYIGILATRGCPFNCAHCLAYKINGHELRRRSPGAVLDEVEYLRDSFGVRHLSFVDDNLTWDRTAFEALCRGWIDRRLGVTWDCSSNGVRFDSLDPELIKLMESSGCVELGVGLESASPRVLADMGRDYDPAQVRDKIREIKRLSKMKVRVFFILGFPTETRADLETTLRFSRTLDADMALFFLFSPFPGTPIHRQLAAQGKLGDIDPAEMDYTRPAVPLADVTKKELKRYQLKAYLGFCFRLRYLGMKIREEGLRPHLWLGRLRRVLSLFRPR